MALKPTVNDLVSWLKLRDTPSSGTLAVYAEAFDTALDLIESRVNLPTGTTDTNYPQRVRSAVLLTASRWAKRSTSPEGVAGMSDIGAVVRIMKVDPDVEFSIQRFLKLDGFY